MKNILYKQNKAEQAARQLAREKGLVIYVSKIECGFNHDGRRLVSTGGCCECVEAQEALEARSEPPAISWHERLNKLY